MRLFDGIFDSLSNVEINLIFAAKKISQARIDYVVGKSESQYNFSYGSIRKCWDEFILSIKKEFPDIYIYGMDLSHNFMIIIIVIRMFYYQS